MTNDIEREHSSQLFQERLKAARRNLRMTQDQLAAAAGFSPVTLSKLETGVNKPTYEVFVALAYALKVTPNYLTGWDDEENSEKYSHRRILLNELNIAVASLPDEWLHQLIELAQLARDGR